MGIAITDMDMEAITVVMGMATAVITEDTTEVMAMDIMVTTTALRNTFTFMFMIKRMTAPQVPQVPQEQQAPVQATIHQPIRRFILFQATDTDIMATMVTMATVITATVTTDMDITESITSLSSTTKVATTDMQ